jgi:hypothetical protein
MDCIDKITTAIDEPKGQTFIASEVTGSVPYFMVVGTIRQFEVGNP